MAHQRDRSRERKAQDRDPDEARFASAAGEGVSGNEVVGMGGRGARGRTRARRPEDDATWSGTASPEVRPVHKDAINNPENFRAASRSGPLADASSFYSRARRRRSSAGDTSAPHAPAGGRAAGREEGGLPPSMDDIARGYGVDRNAFYGSGSYYTRGAETDWSFRNRAESESPYFGDNLGAGAGEDSRGSDLGPGTGANRALGYGAVPSFGRSGPRGSATGGSGVGFGPPPGYGERPALRGRQGAERGGATPSDARRFDRGSMFGTVNLPSTGARGDVADHPEREARRSRWRREPLTARDIMTKDVKSVHADASIRDVARIMRDENAGVVPVVGDDDTLQGLVTDRDIVMRSVAEGKDPMRLTVADLMTRDLDAATPDEALVDVVRLMGDEQIRRVPVVDEHDRLVGIISLADVATRADYDTDLQDALEEISMRRSFWSGLG